MLSRAEGKRTHEYEKGAGGKLQNYDSKGRYASSPSLLEQWAMEAKKKSKEPSKLEKRLMHFETLIARKPNEEFIEEVYNVLKDVCPKKILYVLHTRYDEYGNRWGELDFETTRCVIEVKGGHARGNFTQYKKESDYAKSKNKLFYVYAPRFTKARAYELRVKNQMQVITNTDDLRKIMTAIHRKKGKK